VVAISIWGITRIQVETDYLGFFDGDSVIRTENDRIATALAGTQPIYIVIDGSEAGSVTQLETIRALDALQRFVIAQPGVDLALSLVDYLALMRRVLQPDTPPGLPESQSELNQLLMLADQKQIKPVLNAERTLANLVVRTSLSRSSEVSAFVERVREFAGTQFPRGVVVRPTGTVVLLSQSADELAWGQITGLWQELTVLLLLLSIMFLSLRVGVLALIPNVVPTVILFGLMGWLQIDLNICTSMIAAIAIGIAIDDTIHLLSRFNSELHRTGSQEEAILNAVGSVGQSAFFIALALSAGFFIVCLSNFQPVRHFGLLSGMTMGIALLVELFLTPALVTTTKIATLWDFLFLRLGPEPHRQIPLFEGLRSFQAKLVVLMGRLQTAKPGERIAELGELSPEMYVFLNGHAIVFHEEPTQVLRTIRRGDVVGEMGLVRASPRSANVIATQPTDYLVLDACHLERLQRRYPRIAATVYLNLARILSDRLETTTTALSQAAGRSPSQRTQPPPNTVPSP
ncbi:MAG TPA: MMPL family transporter, partial [Terriglobales bacterium]|nr:MMPL family transporter [Terriglobales bacterium]